MKKVSESQIQELYTFTRAHFVEHYDLQTELVDHLANDIETMWQDTPKLTFEDAKNKAFKKFGIFGFMDAIEQKAKAMNKRYRKYFWVELKKWFELPQIITTILLFCMFYTAFSSEYVSYFSISFLLLIGAWCTYKSILLNRQFRKRKEKSNKKWMLEELIFKQAGCTMLVFMSNFYNIFNISNQIGNNYLLTFWALLFTLLVLMNYISFELIPKKSDILLKEAYPEFCL